MGLHPCNSAPPRGTMVRAVQEPSNIHQGHCELHVSPHAMHSREACTWAKCYVAPVGTRSSVTEWVKVH